MSKKSQLTPYKVNDLFPFTCCLSSSQVLLCEEDPKAFAKAYVMQEKDPPSKAMTIGSIFAELHHHRNFDYKTALKDIKAPKRIQDLFAEIIKFFPKVDAEVPLVCDIDGYQIRATLDGYDKKTQTIIENKTGNVEWTQQRADESDQITLQAFVHWKKYGKLPKKIFLNWVDMRPSSTKHLVTFETKRTLTQVKAFEKRVLRVIDCVRNMEFFL